MTRSRPAVAQYISMLLLSAIQMSWAQFVVETNSMRIKQPDTLAGEFDVAIGDVSLLSILWQLADVFAAMHEARLHKALCISQCCSYRGGRWSASRHRGLLP